MVPVTNFQYQALNLLAEKHLEDPTDRNGSKRIGTAKPARLRSVTDDSCRVHHQPVMFVGGLYIIYTCVYIYMYICIVYIYMNS
jgi:hypothetical protein